MIPEIKAYFDKFGETFSFMLFMDIPDTEQDRVIGLIDQAMKGERGAVVNADLSDLPPDADI